MPKADFSVEISMIRTISGVLMGLVVAAMLGMWQLPHLLVEEACKDLLRLKMGLGLSREGDLRCLRSLETGS